MGRSKASGALPGTFEGMMNELDLHEPRRFDFVWVGIDYELMVMRHMEI